MSARTSARISPSVPAGRYIDTPSRMKSVGKFGSKPASTSDRAQPRFVRSTGRPTKFRSSSRAPSRRRARSRNRTGRSRPYQRCVGAENRTGFGSRPTPRTTTCVNSCTGSVTASSAAKPRARTSSGNHGSIDVKRSARARPCSPTMRRETSSSRRLAIIRAEKTWSCSPRRDASPSGPGRSAMKT